MLRNEIARLNRLIDALLKANEDLRLQLQTEAQPNGPHNATIANTSEGNLEMNGIIANTFETTPSNLLTPSMQAESIGNNNATLATKVEHTGNNNAPTSNEVESIGNKNSSINYVKQVVPTPAVYDELEVILRSEGGMKGSFGSTEKAAKLLVHFYNSRDGEYAQLRKLTGHSNFGLAKFIRNLKDRGWIYRFGFQQFALNPAARAWVEKAAEAAA